MLPLKKTVWPTSTAHTAGASPRKTRAQKVFIARRSSRFHEAASSAQRFNANHVKRKFFSFASWNLFRMEEFFSTLDELVAAQDFHLRHHHRQRPDRRDLVLHYAEIYPRRLRADPAGPVPARHSRGAARDGLPLLPQLRRCRRAFEFAKHADLHGLPHPGAKRQSEAGAGAGELENGTAG